jgi:glycosyltransferase involved in cell wall biosynthesis
MTEAHAGSVDLLWVTNVPTPYRAPLWASIGEQQSLTVALLAETEPNRSWNVDLDYSRYRVEILGARPIARSGDSVIYAPSKRLLALISQRPKVMVLDGWESPAYLAARWWARRQRVPVMASYRSTQATHRFASGPVPALRKWFFNGAASVLTAGQASTDAVVSMGIPRQRIVEGFNTVDVERFAAGAARWRAQLPARPGHHFLYVGQFIPRKNVQALIRAFEIVRDRHDTLTLVGTGPLEPELRLLVSELKVEDAIVFRGHLDGDDLVRAYAEANTLVLPSLEEVWGLVVNEALAAGLHAVVSTTCGVTPSITDMPGVFPTEPYQHDLRNALRRSRSLWIGPVVNPPVVQHTPKALSTVVIDAAANIGADHWVH